MHITSFRDQPLVPVEWILLIAGYLVPVINLLFFSPFWFIYPLFALLTLVISPRNYLVRFHFLQGLFCFLILVAVLLGATVFGMMSLLTISLGLFWIGIGSYLLFILLTLVLFCFRYSIRLPVIGRMAERFANRVVKRRASSES